MPTYGSTDNAQNPQSPPTNMDVPRVALVSNDGSTLWVNSDSLIKSSTFFADMFNICKLNTSSVESEAQISIISRSNESILIDTNKKVLELFVDFVSVSQPSLSRFNNLEDTVTLYKLCQFYDFNPDLIGMIKTQLKRFSLTQSWKLLEIASKINDEELIEMALKELKWGEFILGIKGDNREFWERLESLSPIWRIHLLKITLGDPKGNMNLPLSLPITADFPSQQSKYWQKIMDRRLNFILKEETRSFWKLISLFILAIIIFFCLPFIIFFNWFK
ncbi:uncharacterized protein I206_100609 [Kwoniella pini CBS 10737]|uniref:BTB domain-containing protein n=1 Tax=Kwoniella pini CBS 10737 TaxID=1296096 RepID=A0A1B9ID40_9TREE|nr:uncharacterized protein I206_00716 [Kwoniella pini CBS 10737]OCF53413.1 hypothetical protein I206_00716 [Kwoniella pini CBS 10737]